MSSAGPIRVCTRGSLLARTQSQWVINRLTEANPGVSFVMVIVTTTGDVISQSNDSASAQLDKGMFTKEIEEALLENKADIAIHSLKDLPTELPEGLTVGSIPKRGDPRDALIGSADILERLKSDAGKVKIGTSSIRRKAQLRAMFLGCNVVDLRGNVDTRLSKAADGTVDAIVLAAAGLERLGRAGEITEYLDPKTMLPAPAQGALAIEIRSGDAETAQIVEAINCTDTSICATAERSFLHALGSGCRAPVGAFASVVDHEVILNGRVISEDGNEIFEGHYSGNKNEPTNVGVALAKQLLAEGAGKILDACREHS